MFIITIGYNNSLQVCRLLLCLYTLFDDFIYHIECKCETIESIWLSNVAISLLGFSFLARCMDFAISAICCWTSAGTFLGNKNCSIVDLLIAKHPPAKCLSENSAVKKSVVLLEFKMPRM